MPLALQLATARPLGAVLLAAASCQSPQTGQPLNPASQRPAQASSDRTAVMTYAPPEVAAWFRAEVERLERTDTSELPKRLARSLQALAANMRTLSGKLDADAIGVAAARLKNSLPGSADNVALLVSALETARRALLARTETLGYQWAHERRDAEARLENALRAIDRASNLTDQRAYVLSALKASVDLVYLGYESVPPFAAQTRGRQELTEPNAQKAGAAHTGSSFAPTEGSVK